MKIGIISDTHGCLAAWRKAIAGPFADVDMIVHAGDVFYHGPRNPLPDGYDPLALADALNSSPVPIIFCRGNCDAPVDQDLLRWPLLMPFAFLQADGVRIFAAHELEKDPSLVELGRRYGADVLIGGHTHIASIVQTDQVARVNPGSPALPKGPGGRASVAVLSADSVRVVDLDGGRTLLKAALGGRR